MQQSFFPVDPTAVHLSDPVFTARIRADLHPRADEVCAHHWARPEDVRVAVEATPFVFSPWMVAQVPRMALYSR